MILLAVSLAFATAACSGESASKDDSAAATTSTSPNAQDSPSADVKADDLVASDPCAGIDSAALAGLFPQLEAASTGAVPINEDAEFTDPKDGETWELDSTVAAVIKSRPINICFVDSEIAGSDSSMLGTEFLTVAGTAEDTQALAEQLSDGPDVPACPDSVNGYDRVGLCTYVKTFGSNGLVAVLVPASDVTEDDLADYGQIAGLDDLFTGALQGLP